LKSELTPDKTTVNTGGNTPTVKPKNELTPDECAKRWGTECAISLFLSTRDQCGDDINYQVIIRDTKKRTVFRGILDKEGIIVEHKQAVSESIWNTDTIKLRPDVYSIEYTPYVNNMPLFVDRDGNDLTSTRRVDLNNSYKIHDEQFDIHAPLIEVKNNYECDGTVSVVGEGEAYTYSIGKRGTRKHGDVLHVLVENPSGSYNVSLKACSQKCESKFVNLMGNCFVEFGQSDISGCNSSSCSSSDDGDAALTLKFNPVLWGGFNLKWDREIKKGEIVVASTDYTDHVYYSEDEDLDFHPLEDGYYFFNTDGSQTQIAEFFHDSASTTVGTIGIGYGDDNLYQFDINGSAKHTLELINVKREWETSFALDVFDINFKNSEVNMTFGADLRISLWSATSRHLVFDDVSLKEETQVLTRKYTGTALVGGYFLIGLPKKIRVGASFNKEDISIMLELTKHVRFFYTHKLDRRVLGSNMNNNWMLGLQLRLYTFGKDQE